MNNSKIIKTKWIIIVFILLFLFSFCFSNNEEEQKKTILKTIYKTLDFSHINPININDNFSKIVYNKYFEKLDSQKRFFLQKDINNLSLYKDKIDDFWINADTTFFDAIIKCFYQRIKEVECICQDILKKNFNFNKKDIYYKYDNYFPKNKEERMERWRKYMKFLTLLEIKNYIKEKEKISKKHNKYILWKNSFINEEKKSREKVKEYIEECFRKLKMVKKLDWFSIYVNTILSQYDPHTNFFSTKEKEMFNLNVSGQTEGIGLVLQDEKGYATVVNIVIGSPAWKSKKIDIGDKIIRVSNDLNSKPQNIVGMLLENSIRLIKGKKGTKVKLIIQNKNGSIDEVVLTRDVIEKREIFAKVFLISDKKNKYGLICLPEFYFNPENKNGRNAANDIRKIIQELKKENIKGIIIDIRNNGGGSLDTVIKISSFFLGKVPIVQIGGQPPYKKILNSSHTILWKGPLVVLVNEQSASASEILAAAIKDYKRGIIVGSAQTYGKGTVQSIYTLNRLLLFYKKEELGILKLTMNKFYRINGISTQLKGVHSDIVIPSIHSSSLIMEKDLHNPIKCDSIDPTIPTVTTYTLDENKLKSLKLKSMNRIKNNNKLMNINKINNKIQLLENKLSKNNIYHLHWKDSYYENLKMNKYLQKFRRYLKNHIYTKVFPINNNYQIISFNENELEFQKKWINSLKKDFYISECVNILRDFNN
ncbi:carboxy terminal-processing peptidase [Blattabacterium cuenoti]|uniref:carboxy terminal-processing peptidase n=1 Tax=Blattabacterium cuenoti TaxID=1653831 RepID=UPI001EE9FBE6|nr:carboxy terminal-processing peptidase [Blattabacterium cuenoti]